MYRFLFSLSNKSPVNLTLIKFLPKSYKEAKEVKVVRLNLDEINTALDVHQMHEQWTMDTFATNLHKHYKFSTFKETFTFMNEIALIAEDMGHYPLWKNTYNQVQVQLTTDECGGITMKDILLAHAIESISYKIKLGVVNTVCDTKRLITREILDEWTNNYTKADQYIEAIRTPIAQI